MTEGGGSGGVGPAVSILCFVSGDGGILSKTFDLAAALIRAGCRVQTVFMGKMPTHPYLRPSDVGAIHLPGRSPRRAVLAVRAFGTDLVIARYFTYSGIPAVLSGRLLNVPVFATVHGAGIRFHSRPALLRRPLRVVARTILPCFDRLFPVSTELGYDLTTRIGVAASRVVVQPNGVDHVQFAPDNTPAGPPVDIMFAGSIYREKRLDVLFDALRILAGRGLRPTVEVVGDGPTRAGWERDATDLAGVRFRGWVPDMRGEFPRARLFVLSSDLEGSPNALMEAMACGVPPVATAVGEAPAVVRDGDNGRLVPPGNPRALADALRELLGDAACRAAMGVRARRTIESGRTWDDAACAFLRERDAVLLERRE